MSDPAHSAPDDLPEESSTPRDLSESKLLGKDISSVLDGWEYEPGSINVRKITGTDGRSKLQMRLDLGLLQMELSGRPDGQRPHGCESMLIHFEKQLEKYSENNGTELGFTLTRKDCQQLREEAVMYYHRYLSLFVLEEFPGVIRDTARNLRVLDICAKYGEDEQDRLILEQYRPYITMMNTRAKASLLVKEGKLADALELVDTGLENIRQFFDKFGQVEAFPHSNEVKILKKVARDIKKKLPVDPIVKLKVQLDKAIKAERYEDAARLRDELKRRETQPQSSDTK